MYAVLFAVAMAIGAMAPSEARQDGVASTPVDSRTQYAAQDSLPAVLATHRHQSKSLDKISTLTLLSLGSYKPAEYAKGSGRVKAVERSRYSDGQVTIRVLRRVRGTCSGGRCG